MQGYSAKNRSGFPFWEDPVHHRGTEDTEEDRAERQPRIARMNADQIKAKSGGQEAARAEALAIMCRPRGDSGILLDAYPARRGGLGFLLPSREAGRECRGLGDKSPTFANGRQIWATGYVGHQPVENSVATN